MKRRYRRSSTQLRVLTLGVLTSVVALILVCGFVVAPEAEGPSVDSGSRIEAPTAPTARTTAESAAVEDASTAWADPRPSPATALRILDVRGVDAIDRSDTELGTLPPQDQKKINRLVKLMSRKEKQLAKTEAKISQYDDLLAQAQQEMAAALAMPEDTPKEQKQKAWAIKKAQRKIDKYTKLLGKWNAKADKLLDDIAAIIAAIEAIDPNYFNAVPSPQLAAAGDAGQITWSWTTIDSASEYNLYLSATPGVTVDSATPLVTTQTNYVQTGLPPDYTGYAVVTAVVDRKESPESVEASAATMALPGAPANLTATPGSSAVTLSWADAPGATSYDLYWDVVPGIAVGQGNLIADVSSPFVHGNLLPGATYHYVVVGQNAAGEGPGSGAQSATIAVNAAANEGSPLGINLHAVTYWSPEWVFIDAFRQARDWYSQEANTGAWDTKHPLTTTPDGWPILGTNPSGNPEAAATLMFRDVGGNYPAGDYICLYEGQGNIEFGFDAHIASQQPGRIVVRVDNPTNAGIFMRITSTPDPSDPVRNLRLIMPGFEPEADTTTFHPDFLDRIAPFKVIRFMDWQRTNDNEHLVNWSDRAAATYYTQADPDRGVALEYMVELCNELGADGWFCIPHRATDAFVTEFAEQIRDTLRDDLQVYVEYSNEVWNGQFKQSKYAETQGLALDLSSDGFKAKLRYHSQRSVEIFGIFESVFGSTDRLVRVLGSQSANPWVGRQVMDWNDAYQHADAVAIAPYFGGNVGGNSSVGNMSVDQVLDMAEDDMAETWAEVQENQDDAAARGLELMAYEGGQHLAAKGGLVNDSSIVAKLIAANKHDRMGDLYTVDLDHWRTTTGMGMFMVFSSMSNYTKWGSWGLMEHENQDPSTAPKYEAVLDFIEANRQ